MPSSSVKTNVDTAQLSSMIWCEIVNDEILRIRCNRCQEKFFQGSYFDHVNEGEDWLGVAISHIYTTHPKDLLPLTV